MAAKRVAFHWSGGKDSAFALRLLLARDDVRVDRLVTTVDADRGESTVHALPVELLRAQARSIGIPLQTVTVPGPGLEGYVDAIGSASRRMRSEGVDAVGFGDLDRSGVREHKELQFGPLGLEVLEPLWGLTSEACIERFLDSGIQAVTVVVDASVLDRSYLGVALDRAFVERLPEGVDPCGELGEYHSFAYAGAPLRSPVRFTMTPVREVEHEIGTTQGRRTYRYWLATPRTSHSTERAAW